MNRCNDRETTKKVIIVIIIIVLENLDSVKHFYLLNGSTLHTECGQKEKSKIVLIEIWSRITEYHFWCLSNLFLEIRHQLKSKNKKVIYQRGIIYQILLTIYFIRIQKCWAKLAIFSLLLFFPREILQKWISRCKFFLGFYQLEKIFAWLYFVKLLTKNQFINYHRIYSFHKWSHRCSVLILTFDLCCDVGRKS